MAPRSAAPRVHLPTLQDAPPAGAKVDFRSTRRTLAPAYIDEALGPNGHLARLLPGYESRPGQLAMSKAIDRGITDGKHLLVEAPCGSGKGIGYLTPAIHHAVGAGKKVVVATANIALQEQLISKDLPLLRAALPMPFTFGLAKGKSNYLCVEAFEDAEAAGVRDPRWNQIREWAATTTKGDVSELSFEPGPLRAKFTVSSDDCMGRACPSFERCFAETAKREYQAADVVVTNYHLLLLDMMIKLEDPESGPLPPWAILVVDEGHSLPDIARGVLGFKVTKGMVDNAARLLASQNDDIIDADLASDLRADGAEYFENLRIHARSREYKVRLREKEETHAGPLASGLNTAGERLSAAAEFAEGKRRAKLRKAGQRASVLAHQLWCADELTAGDRRVYCIEVEERGDRESAALCSKLIFPADVLRPKLFDVPDRVVIGTSATLAVDKSFDFIAHELGAEAARELAVPTPFDFERQALLVVPRGMPDPKKRDEHEAYVARTIVEVAEASGGRLLGLFTSRRGMRKAAEEFGRRRRGTEPWNTILVQGDAPRGQLVARFKAEVGSVLLGLDSFWEGVDVPGEALSVVVIDRLPFATPDDPVLDAVDATLPGGAFKTWSLPRAVTAIRQGQGRLIRTKTDRGVVVILDDRIVNAGYGQAFLRSLPPMRMSRRLEDVGSFLGASPGEDSAMRNRS